MFARAAVFAIAAASMPWLPVEGAASEPPLRKLESGPRATLEVDAVELVRTGEDVPGQEEMAVDHGGYRYLFKDEKNKAEFEADPAKYRIQLGGACARMGPLSGSGKPSIHAVHEGRIYIFASRQCREGFKKSPEVLLDKPEPAPAAEAPQVARGKELLARALAAHGGEAAAKLRSIRYLTSREVDQGAQVLISSKELRIGLVGTPVARQEERWGDSVWGHAFARDKGWSYGSDSVERLVPEQIAELRRIADRSLVVLLRAGAGPDEVVVATPAPDGADAGLDYVTVWRNHASSTLGIDRVTGRVAYQSFRGRGPNLALGRIERRFRDYRQVGTSGVVLPFTFETRFNGEAIEGGTTTYSQITADEPVRLDDLVPSG